MRYLCTMNLILRLFLAFTILSMPLCGKAQLVQSPKHEYRAVWLTTIKGLDWPREDTQGDYPMQKEQLCRVLDSLQVLHVNTILLQTRIRGDVIYPSAEVLERGRSYGFLPEDITRYVENLFLKVRLN